MRTVAELRPPRLYSVFRTTIGSLPCMMTLPARISWAIFMALMSSWKRRSDGPERCRQQGAKPRILTFRGDEADQLADQIGPRRQLVAPTGAVARPLRGQSAVDGRQIERAVAYAVPAREDGAHLRRQRRRGAGE